MFSSLIFSINAVLPVFIIILFGYVLKRLNFIDEHTVKKVNNIVFQFALPCMLFRDVSKTNFFQSLDLMLLSYAITTTLIIFVVTWVVTSSFIKDKRSIGAFVQGVFRGNYAIVGITLVNNILGGQMEGKGVLITAFIVPLYNILAVIVLTVTRNNGDLKNTVKKSFIGIVKNPLIISIFVGVVFSLSGMRLPLFLGGAVGYLADMTTPLALIAIGGSISIRSFNVKLKPALAVSFIKLVLTPCIFVPIAIAMGMRGEALVTLFILYGTPTAISSYVMAYNMKGDAELAANIILVTTLLSTVTVTFGVYLIKIFGYIV